MEQVILDLLARVERLEQMISSAHAKPVTKKQIEKIEKQYGMPIADILRFEAKSNRYTISELARDFGLTYHQVSWLQRKFSIARTPRCSTGNRKKLIELNKSRTKHFVEIDGESIPLKHYCNGRGLSYSGVLWRMKQRGCCVL